MGQKVLKVKSIHLIAEILCFDIVVRTRLVNLIFRIKSAKEISCPPFYASLRKEVSKAPPEN